MQHYQPNFYLVDPIAFCLSLKIIVSSDILHSFIMSSTSRSLFSFFSVFCTLVQAKSHGNAHWHRHSSRAAVVPAGSSSPNIGVVYDGTSQLGAFSGKIGFSVDWSPLPLSSSDNLNLGTFMPQLWTFQDSNRESPYHQTYQYQ